MQCQGDRRIRAKIWTKLGEGQSRFHYLPWCGLFVTLPYDDQHVHLHRFDLTKALKSSGKDFLFVTSVPPYRALKGRTLSYRIKVMSKQGGLRFRLESGPEGLTVKDNGQVTWNLPAETSMETATVIVSIRDRAGNEIIHAFELAT